MTSSFVLHREAACALSLLLAVSVGRGADVHSLEYAGSAAALESLDADINAARTDSVAAARIATDLLAQLGRPDTSLAGRQAICQRLGWLLPAQANGAAVPNTWAPLVRMLTQPGEVEFARLALEPIPGAAVDALFVDALQHVARSSPPDNLPRRALLQSIAQRRIAAATPTVIPLLADQDADVAAAAVRALGAIATHEAIVALTEARANRPAAAVALVAAVSNNREFSDSAEGGRVMASLLNERNLPAGVYSAALDFVIVHSRPEDVSREMVKLLHEVPWPSKEVVIGRVTNLHAPELTERLAQALPTLDTPTTVAILVALGRRGDPAATDAAIAALGSESSEIRLAAIESIGALPGSRVSAKALLTFIATSASAEEAKATRNALARLSGLDPDEEILAVAKQAEPKLQSAAIEQLALRNTRDALPLLRTLRSAEVAAVRGTAATALGELGEESDQARLLDWAIHTSDDDERSHALRAVVAVTKRIHRPDAARSVWQAIETATPEVASRLLPVLARLGDSGSANCAARLATIGTPLVASAAANTLARWPDSEALPAQVLVATKASDAAVRRIGLHAAITTLDRAVDPWTADRTAAIAQLAKTAPDERDSLALLRLLRRASDADAEAVTAELARSAAAAAAAVDAKAAIAVNRRHRTMVTTSGGWGLADMTDGNAGTAWTITATAGQWVQADFGEPRPLARVILDEGSRAENVPGKLEVFVTDDPSNPGMALQTVMGQLRRTTIELPAGTHGRFLILKNTTERVDGYWSIAELIVE